MKDKGDVFRTEDEITETDRDCIFDLTIHNGSDLGDTRSVSEYTTIRDLTEERNLRDNIEGRKRAENRKWN